MLSAAIARIASSSGKRGLPGGGVSAGEGAATTRPAYAWRVRRPDGFELRLAAIAAAALAVRVVAAIVTNDHLVQGDAMTFHQVAQHLADGQGFRQPFAAAPTAEHPPGGPPPTRSPRRRPPSPRRAGRSCSPPPTASGPTATSPTGSSARCSGR